jgi:hypothetical protein
MAKRDVGKNLQKVTDEQLSLIKNSARNFDRNRRSALFQRIAANPLASILPESSDDINDDPDKKN